MAFGDVGRERNSRRRKHRASYRVEFLNPYPWMSAIEARVALYLESKELPYTYRYFDGDSPHLRFLMPDYHPEFTLREYKVVIVVLGNYFSQLPGILDRQALAQTLLEQDGWKFVALFESEILTALPETLEGKVPEFVTPAITGAKRPSPFGLPEWNARRKAWLGALALKRKTRYLDPDNPGFTRARFSQRRLLRERSRTRRERRR